jgi:pimeloyl-ACP methyl ester carboxylesterase
VSSDTEVWVWEPTPFNAWADLVDHLASYSSAFLRPSGPPVIFYGHSFGGLVAFELACILQNGMICMHKKVVNKFMVADNSTKIKLVLGATLTLKYCEYLQTKYGMTQYLYPCVLINLFYLQQIAHQYKRL